MGQLWERIKSVALTDVAVLVRGIDRDSLERMEHVLLEADFGPVAFELTEYLEEQLRRGQLKDWDGLRENLRDEIAKVLAGPDDPGALASGDDAGPAVFLMLGVNGVGKTTQTAKIAHRLLRQGKTLLLAAADTYRAGASEQLQSWAERLGVPYVTGSGDPAAVAFDALVSAEARGIEVVLVDTAGRLHTHADLMEELKKIVRVLARRRVGAPHESLLVLDGTVGQNAVRQGVAFTDAVPITGLIITKLNGTARGGAVVALKRELDVPIRFLGLGEGLDDLEVFDPVGFAERLLAD